MRMKKRKKKEKFKKKKKSEPGGLKLALFRRGLSLGRRLGYRISVKLWKAAAADGRTHGRFSRNRLQWGNSEENAGNVEVVENATGGETVRIPVGKMDRHTDPSMNLRPLEDLKAMTMQFYFFTYKKPWCKRLN